MLRILVVILLTLGGFYHGFKAELALFFEHPSYELPYLSLITQ